MILKENEDKIISSISLNITTGEDIKEAILLAHQMCIDINKTIYLDGLNGIDVTFRNNRKRVLENEY